MEIRVLGASGTGVSATRTTTSFLLDSRIALDCGENFTRSVLSLGISKVPLFLITHTHADHIIGLIMWLWRSYIYEQDKKSPIIIIPAILRDDIIKITELMGFPGNPMEKYFDIRGIEPDSEPLVFELPDQNGETPKTYRISWIVADHFKMCYSYKIESDPDTNTSKCAVFSSDTRYNPPLSELAKNADIIFHEATFLDDMTEALAKIKHACPSDAAKIAKDAQGKTLVLVHTPRNMTESDLKDAKTIFNNIQIAKDGDILKI